MSAAPRNILIESTASEGAVLGAGGLPPRDQHHADNHYGQRQQPSENEEGTVEGSPLRAQDEDERRDRYGLEGDGQADDRQIDYGHRALRLLTARGRLWL